MAENTTLDASTGAPLGEISHGPPALELFLDKHQMKLVVLAVILAIAAAGYVVFKGIKQSGEETAGALLSKSEDISELQSVVKNHEGTEAAFSAKVLLAEKQWEDGQQDDAISTLKAFVESDRDHPARPSAEASLATKLWAQGKADEAKEFFEDLSEDADSKHLAPYALISLGDIAMAKGDMEAASESYEAVESDYPGSTYSQEAVSRMLLLKAKAPVEVSAPMVVPDAKIISEDTDGGVEVPAGDASVEDLINAVKGERGGAENTLLPQEEPPVPAE